MKIKLRVCVCIYLKIFLNESSPTTVIYDYNSTLSSTTALSHWFLFASAIFNRILVGYLTLKTRRVLILLKWRHNTRARKMYDHSYLIWINMYTRRTSTCVGERDVRTDHIKETFKSTQQIAIKVYCPLKFFIRDAKTTTHYKFKQID